MHERFGSDDRTAKKLSVQPLYAQLRDTLIKRVTSGTWRSGDVIPNEIELAREFNLSAGTVRKALDLMERARIIVRQQGRGTFVADPSATGSATRFEPFHRPDGARVSCAFADTSITEADANIVETKLLRLKDEDRVFHVTQTRMSDGKPFMLEHATVPVSLIATPTQAGEPSYDIIRAAKMNNVLLGTGVEQISIEPASDEVAGPLMIAATTPVMMLERIIYSVEDVPVEMRKAWCLSGHNHYKCALN